MNKENILSLILLIVFLAILIAPPILIINKRHNERLLRVATSKIEETALNCYNEEVCNENKITLKELYDLKKLDKMTDPITKEYYNENSYVIIEDNQAKFYKEKNI